MILPGGDLTCLVDGDIDGGVVEAEVPDVGDAPFEVRVPSSHLRDDDVGEVDGELVVVV